MAKLTLSSVDNLQSEKTAIAAINSNNVRVQNAIENTLSRDGSTPNQMLSVIDMNSNRIVNLGPPVSDTDAVRLIDITEGTILSGTSAGVDDTIVNGETQRAPSQNAVYDALALKADSSHTHAQTDIVNLTTDLAAKAATDLSNVLNATFLAKATAAGVSGGATGVYDGIRDGVTATAPTENAVYDALALKAATDLTNVSNADFAAKATAAGFASSDSTVYDYIKLRAVVNKGRISLDSYVSTNEGLDCAVGVAQAVADLVAQGNGGEILLGARPYVMMSAIGITANNISFRGVNNKVSKFVPYGNVIAPVYWQGTGFSAYYSLAADFRARCQTIYLTSVDGLAYGDDVYIQCATPIGGYLTSHNRIIAVNTSAKSIAFDRDVPFASTEGTVTVAKTSYISGGGMSNIGLNGYSSTSSSASGVYAQSTKDMAFTDLYYEGFNQSSGQAVFLDLGMDNTFKGDHYMYRCGAAATTNTADFFPQRQGGLKSDRIISEMASGFGPQWQWCSHASADTVISRRAGKRGMKVQGSRNCKFKTVESTWATYIGMGLSYGSRYNHFSDVHITFSGEVTGNRSGLWFSDQGSCYNKFGLVESIGAGEYEVAFYGSDQFNHISHLAYSGDGSKIFNPSGTNTITSFSTVGY